MNEKDKIFTHQLHDETSSDETQKASDLKSHSNSFFRISKKEILSILITAFLSAIGWCTVYFLVLKPEVDVNKAKFIKMTGIDTLLEKLDVADKSGKISTGQWTNKYLQLQIKELEIKSLNLENQIINIRNRMQATGEMISIIQSLRPNMQIEQPGFNKNQDSSIDIEALINNIGTSAVKVNNPIIKIWDTKQDNYLIEHRDYYYNSYFEPTLIQPGQKRKTNYNISFNGTPEPGRVFWVTMRWDVITEKVAVDLSSMLLNRQLSKKELNKITHSSYEFTQALRY